jgi:predicted lipoprotein
MRHKTIKYIINILLIIVIVFLSLDIHPLDSERKRPVSEVFDVEEYVAQLWTDQLPEMFSNAPEISYLIGLLNDDPETAFDRYSRKLGISNTHYFYVSGTGTVDAVDETTVHLTVDGNIPVELETVYVFGNAIRDGSGLVAIDEFQNMMDFNMVSARLNRLVKSNVIDPFRNEVQPGHVVFFTGATEINRTETVPDRLNIIPVQTEIRHGE